MKKENKKQSLLQAAEPVVRQFLTSAGFVEHASNERFANDLKSRFGKTGEEILRAIELRADEKYSDADFYPLKNSNLPLSLAVTFWNKGGLYVSFLNWLVREKLPATSRILDIGCDNGILTCFYAKLFPEAEVVGIDVCESGVARAKELAEKLALKNLSFHVMDVRQAADVIGGKPFGMVTATHVFRSLFGLDHMDAVSSLAEAAKLEIPSEQRATLLSIQSLMAPDSLLVSTESLDYRGTGLWTLMLNQAGLSLNWDRSFIIYWPGPDKKKDTCPILVAEKKGHVVPWTLNDALGFLSYPQLAEKAESVTYNDAAAEALLHAVNPKTLVRGLRVTGPKGAVTEIELWVGGALALTYRHTKGCECRSLQLFSTACVPNLLRQIDETSAGLPSGTKGEFYGEVKVG